MGGTRVSPSLIIPLTPACQVRSPLFFLLSNQNEATLFSLLPHVLSLTPPPPIFLSLTLPSVSVSSGMRCCLRPRIPLSPYAPCGAGSHSFFPHLDRDFNHEGRWPNDVPTLPPVTVFVFPSVCLSFTVTTRTMVPSVHRIINMPPPHCTYPVGHIMKDYFNLIIAHFRLITESSKLSTLSSFFYQTK